CRRTVARRLTKKLSKPTRKQFSIRRRTGCTCRKRFWRNWRRRSDSCARAGPLTALAAQITINNECSARAHGGCFASKPRHKERKIPQSRDNLAIYGARHDRTACVAGRV